MPRIKVATRELIVKEQTHKEFYSKLDKNEKKFKKLIHKEADKLRPKWVTDKMMDSKYIKTTQSFKLIGMEAPEFRQIKLSQTLDKKYPTTDTWGSLKIEKNKAIIAAIKERKEILKERKKFKSDLNQVILSYGTDKKLVAAIPELKDYFNDFSTALAVVPDEQLKKVRKTIKKNSKDKETK